jgi:hypothetical protein
VPDQCRSGLAGRPAAWIPRSRGRIVALYRDRDHAMKLFHRSQPDGEPRPTGYVGDQADKLSRVRALPHDNDERPSAQDRRYGTTIFTRAAQGGFILRPRKKR